MTTRLLNNILTEPRELRRSLAHTLGPGRAALERAAERVRRAAAIYITGIGSSWNAGLAVQSLFDAAGRPVQLVDASELLHFVRLVPDSCTIVLSRSGHSVEIVRLLDKAQEAGAAIIAVTNTPDSPLAQRAAVTLQMEAAFDHNVSITMYSALTLVGGLLAVAATDGIPPELPGAIEASLHAAEQSIADWRRRIDASTWIASDAPTYHLARGGSLGSCHEARLLWEEAAKTAASALGTGAFRHGSQEILTSPTRIGLWLDQTCLREADLALAADLRRLGASVMLIGGDVPDDAADLVLPLPETPAGWQFLIDIIPAQLASERLAAHRGADGDNFAICPYVIAGEGGLAAAGASGSGKP